MYILRRVANFVDSILSGHVLKRLIFVIIDYREHDSIFRYKRQKWRVYTSSERKTRAASCTFRKKMVHLTKYLG